MSESAASTLQEPFVGIRPYTRAHADVFFERREEARTLLETLLTRRVLLLYGESGNGKSSLINAGLVPMLERLRFRDSLQPEVLRVDKDFQGLMVDRRPLAAGGQVADSAFHSLFVQPGESDATPTFTLTAESVLTQLREYLARPQSRHVLLIFDQFEELHTYGGNRSAFTVYADRSRLESERLSDEERLNAQARLAAAIGNLMRAGSSATEYDDVLPVKFLFLFREEYLVKLQALLPDLVGASPLRLPFIPADRLARVIQAAFLPEEKASNRKAGPFMRHPLAEFYTNHAIALREGFKVRSGGIGQNVLTELQVVCTELWSHDEDRRKVSAAANDGPLAMARTINEIITAHFQRALEALGDSKDLALDLLCEMVTSGGTRNIASEPSLRDLFEVRNEHVPDERQQRHPWDTVKSVLKTLEDTRFINAAERNGTAYYDVASEALIPWLSDVRKDRLKTIEDQRLAEERAEQQERLERERRDADVQEELRKTRELAAEQARISAEKAKNEAEMQEELRKTRELAAEQARLSEEQAKRAKEEAQTAWETARKRSEQLAAANRKALRYLAGGLLAAVVIGVPLLIVGIQRQQELAKAKDELRKSRNEIEKARNDKLLLAQQNESLAETNDALTKGSGKLTETISRLTTELEGLRAYAQNTDQQAKTFQDEKKALETAIAELRKQLSAEQNKALDPALTKVQKSIIASNDQLAGARAGIAGIATALDELAWRTGKAQIWGGAGSSGGFGKTMAFITTWKQADATKVFRSDADRTVPPSAEALNPKEYYIAARWDYNKTPKEWLLSHKVKVRNPAKPEKVLEAQPVEWGPPEKTGDMMALSPRLADDLGVKRYDDVSYRDPSAPEVATPQPNTQISRLNNGALVVIAAPKAPVALSQIKDGQTRAIPGKPNWYVWVGKLSRKDQRTVECRVFTTATPPATWYAEAEVTDKLKALEAKVMPPLEIGKDSPLSFSDSSGKKYTLVVTNLSTGLFKNDHVDLELREQ